MIGSQGDATALATPAGAAQLGGAKQGDRGTMVWCLWCQWRVYRRLGATIYTNGSTGRSSRAANGSILHGHIVCRHNGNAATLPLGHRFSRNVATQGDVLPRLQCDAAAIRTRYVKRATVRLDDVSGSQRNTATRRRRFRHGLHRYGTHDATVDNLGGAHRDAAGRAAVGSGIGADGAGVLDAITRLQHNASALKGQAGCLQSARVFYHAALQAIQGTGGQDDQAARSQHRALVFHQSLDGRGLDGKRCQRIVTVKVQGDRLARGHCHRAQLRDDDALVTHLRCQQSDITAECSAQLTFIDHAAGGTVAGKGGLARHEVGIADAMRRGRQAAHVHRRAFAKVHPVGIA